MGKTIKSAMAMLALSSAIAAYPATLSAQTSGAESQEQTPPPPNVPAEGEPRAQEQLPKAPPEEVLTSPPPLEKSKPPSEPAKPAPPLPNTLPPAQKIEPKVPNT